ncbi:hypothetical protein M9H77_35799 [Catharanthus roseus]|uniref:Uncharacterized protein n=1 Tax=Catharanthus roseus TaxID=4058 RepID=A0ACB9ZQY7_CATRO|nr:hypothetical protein M9H77_35799 [Catharanthus roseus]
MQDDLTGVPINRATRIENKVGSQDLRLLIDLEASESLIKERAAARFNDLAFLLGKQKEVLQYTSQVSWLFFDAVISKWQIKQELDEQNLLTRKAVEEAGSDSSNQF